MKKDDAKKLLLKQKSVYYQNNDFFALANDLEKKMTNGLTESEVKLLTELLEKVLKAHEV